MALVDLIGLSGAQVVTLLGGGSVIVVSLCGFVANFVAVRTVENHKSQLNQELERLKGELAKESDLHKLRIRRAEILFEKELEAVSAFGVIYRGVMPRYSRPDMDWHEACEDVADRLEIIESTVGDYHTRYSFVLPNDLRTELQECVAICTNSKFAEHEMPGGQGRAAAMTAGGAFMDKMREIESGMYQLVQNEIR